MLLLKSQEENFQVVRKMCGCLGQGLKGSHSSLCQLLLQPHCLKHSINLLQKTKRKQFYFRRKLFAKLTKTNKSNTKPTVEIQSAVAFSTYASCLMSQISVSQKNRNGDAVLERVPAHDSGG